MYSTQNIFNAKNFNPHKKPISLLNVPICTQGMQRTWWPEAGTITVTGPYWEMAFFVTTSLIGWAQALNQLWYSLIKTHNIIAVLCWWMPENGTYDDVIKWKHFPRYWPFVRGIHRSPVDSPHKGQWRGALMFSLNCALNKRLSKQLWGWWFDTPSRSLCRHFNELFLPTNALLLFILGSTEHSCRETAAKYEHVF